ncbi:hypothetical protein [Arcobacter roscoffensis]|uniref:Uncharacterized protein n=1 Tax=Arcobacter roscoffensis TaxID=2961520 RepID=A0ABY5E0X7_9BACT|nr:hypothetical protein [Arcobacter roscoffensis]UTJ05376.1 hypothetical protein NJU99_08855 [Arcobacter roscoffensis]
MKVPKELLTCKDFSTTAPGTMQSDIATFQTEVFEVAMDCKNKLGKVREKLK